MESLWKQFLGNLIRFVLIYFFGVLTSKGIVEPETATKLADSGATYIVGFLLIVVPLVWQWAKLRFNVKLAGELHKADAETSQTDVKRQVLKTNKFVSPV